MALITYSKVDYESFMYRQLKNTLIAEVTLIRIGSWESSNLSRSKG